MPVIVLAAFHYPAAAHSLCECAAAVHPVTCAMRSVATPSAVRYASARWAEVRPHCMYTSLLHIANSGHGSTLLPAHTHGYRWHTPHDYMYRFQMGIMLFSHVLQRMWIYTPIHICTSSCFGTMRHHMPCGVTTRFGASRQARGFIEGRRARTQRAPMWCPWGCL